MTYIGIKRENLLLNAVASYSILSTTRNLALPLIMRSYAACACSSGYLNSA